jgi:hypothetical protein
MCKTFDLTKELWREYDIPFAKADGSVGSWHYRIVDPVSLTRSKRATFIKDARGVRHTLPNLLIAEAPTGLTMRLRLRGDA